jgi:hypothetical protein
MHFICNGTYSKMVTSFPEIPHFVFQSPFAFQAANILESVYDVNKYKQQI